MSRRGLLARAGGVLAVAFVTAIVTVAAMDRVGGAPGEGSVDVGFARDMAVHHAQAVEMAELIRGRTEDARIEAMAADIVLTQQAQLGRMQGWLALWGRSQTIVGPRMGWMGHAVEGPMPGMATREQLRALANAEGPDAERLFLELMIDHHRAGVRMAQAAATDAQVGDVRRLAAAMVAGQQAEIDAMRALLDERDPAVASAA